MDESFKAFLKRGGRSASAIKRVGKYVAEFEQFMERQRGRLCHDAGVDAIEKLATWEPEALRLAMVAFVERTGFDGIAPLPAETRSALAKARKRPKIVEYGGP